MEGDEKPEGDEKIPKTNETNKTEGSKDTTRLRKLLKITRFIRPHTKDTHSRNCLGEEIFLSSELLANCVRKFRDAVLRV